MKALLSIMDNKLGNEIAEEMKAHFPQFEIIEYRHDGKLFEYPGIKKAAELSIEYNEPILYLHTKGAGNPNEYQPRVRNNWYNWWSFEWYKQWSDGITCIVSGPTKETWFNSFIIYPDAAKIILDKMEISKNRYYYEALPRHLDINLHALFTNVEPTELSNYFNREKFIQTKVNYD